MTTSQGAVSNRRVRTQIPRALSVILLALFRGARVERHLCIQIPRALSVTLLAVFLALRVEYRTARQIDPLSTIFVLNS